MMRLLSRVVAKPSCKMGELLKVWRLEYWRARGARFGVGCTVHGRIHLEMPQNITIGQHCTLNEGVAMFARGRIDIGDDVRISPYVIINTGMLEIDGVTVPLAHVTKPVRICNGVWLGTGCQVLPGVIVGERSVCAAGAVVTRDVPPYVVVAGVPARRIRDVQRSRNV